MFSLRTSAFSFMAGVLGLGQVFFFNFNDKCLSLRTSVFSFRTGVFRVRTSVFSFRTSVLSHRTGVSS